MANEKFRETIQLNEISDATKTSMKVRIIAAIVAILIVLPCVLFGSYLWLAFVVFRERRFWILSHTSLRHSS